MTSSNRLSPVQTTCAAPAPGAPMAAMTLLPSTVDHGPSTAMAGNAALTTANMTTEPSVTRRSVGAPDSRARRAPL